MSMEQNQSKNSKLDVHKYYGKNADDVIRELEQQGYTSIKYDTHRLVQGRSLSPIPDSKTVQIYINSSSNTVQQIIMKH